MDGGEGPGARPEELGRRRSVGQRYARDVAEPGPETVAQAGEAACVAPPPLPVDAEADERGVPPVAGHCSRGSDVADTRPPAKAARTSR